MGRIPGRAVTGEEAAYPASWGFTKDHRLLAVETRPSDPHSVTTIGFLHEGALHIPSLDGASKDWPAYVMADPRVRIKVGDKVYPAMLTRVADADFAQLRASLARKYPSLGARSPGPSELWFFRVSARN